MSKVGSRRFGRRLGLYASVFALVSPAILVFLWMLSLAFKNEVDNTAFPPVFIPNPPTLDNFVQVFAKNDFLLYAWNSVVVSFGATGIALLAPLPDEEVQELLRASAGLNLGMDFLPGSLGFDPVAHTVPPLLASKVLWFDALVSNVDRSWRNPNLLMWHRELFLIDHGACLVLQEQFAADTAPHDSLPAIARWIFLPTPVEPVNAILSTPARHSAAPVAPRPVTTCSTSGRSGTAICEACSSHRPIAGVYSLGLNTTALPAASA